MMLHFVPVLPFLMLANLGVFCDGRALDTRSFVREKSWRSSRILPEIRYSAEGNLQNFVVQGCPDDFRVVLGPGETEIAVLWDEDGSEQEVRIYTGSANFANHIRTNVDTIYSDSDYGDDPQCNFLVTLEGQSKIYESNYEGDSSDDYWESSESYSDWDGGAVDLKYGWNWQTATTIESKMSTDVPTVASATNQSPDTTQVTSSYIETGSVSVNEATEQFNQSSATFTSPHGVTGDSEGNGFVSTLPPSDQSTDERRTTSYAENIESTTVPVSGTLNDFLSDDETVTSMAPSTLYPDEATSHNVSDAIYESHEFRTQRPTTESGFVSTDRPEGTSDVTTPGTTQNELPTTSSLESLDVNRTSTNDILKNSTIISNITVSGATQYELPTTNSSESSDVTLRPTTLASSTVTSNVTPSLTTQDELTVTSSAYESFDVTLRPATDILLNSTTESSISLYSQEEFTTISSDHLDVTDLTTFYDIEDVDTTVNYVTDVIKDATGTTRGDDVTQPPLHASKCRLPDGTFIKVGESVITMDCSFVCLCDVTESLVCIQEGCGRFEICEQRNEITGCFCQEGFTFDGQECVKDCPSAFRPFEDSCYYFHKKRMRFEEAEQFCEKMEANLASIHNERENEFISALVGVKKEVWIGASRGDEEPLEIITNGSLERPQFISTKIPAGLYRLEFSIDPVSNAHIFLGPEPEVVKQMYEIVLGSSGEVNLEIRRCPDCTDRISWFRTQLIPHNATKEERFYLTFKYNMMEIGRVGAYSPLGSYVDMTGHRHNVRYIGFASWNATVTWKLFSDFTWSDGSSWTYENWYLTEPDLFPVGDVRACVFVNYKFNPAWNDDNCKHKRRFVCKQ